MKKLIEDIVIAFMVLTRIPLNKFLQNVEEVEISRGQWAYPLVGLFVGLIIFLLIQTLEFLGLPKNPAILIALSSGIFLTGALHDDGLADFFDSLGGQDYDSRQKILRDSRVGSFGVLALISSFLIRFALISELTTDFAILVGLLASSSISRYSILIIFNQSDISKESGLTKELKILSPSTLIFCGLFSIIWLLPAGIIAFTLALFLGLLLVYFFTKIIVPFNRGLSGDLLGLSVQLFEILILSIICIAFLK